MSEEMERAEGVCGELVLRRGPAGLEIIANGVFLVSAANGTSSRALVSAVWPHVSGSQLRVLIGGLGIGDALDEALACDRVAEVTVAELEPVIVRWFRMFGGETARHAAEGERAGRVRIVTADVADVIAGGPAEWDVVALDTDNGPEWLVRDENAGIYCTAGVERVRDALRPGGVAVFWSPERYPAFEAVLRDVFASVITAAAHDVVDGRRHDYVMYIGLQTAPLSSDARSEVDWTRGNEGGHGMELTWDEPSEVAWALIDAYPDVDPLDLNFVDLHRMIVELPSFVGDRDAASESLLEAIVMAWHEQR